MPEAVPSQTSTQRRRSERVMESLPIIVRGVDLLGQPFEERTATLAFNLHGCRYPSRYHLPKNTWVSIEIARGSKLHNVRARVAWVQRPRSVRELFQIAVELESAANIWGYEPNPASWAAAETAAPATAAFSPEEDLRYARESEAGAVFKISSKLRERTMGDQTNITSDSALAPETSLAHEPVPAADNPLLRELRAALESQARQAVESAAEQATEQIRRSTEELAEKRAAAAEDAFRRWMGEFEQVRSGSREQFSADLAARQEEFLAVLKAEFEENFSRARRILEDLDQKAAVIRMEGESAAETASRMAQARLQIEAAEAARTQQPAAPTRQETAAVEDAAARWSERLESEMAVAQAQWNELLQSSLDSGIERLAAQLSERSQDVLRSAEQRMSERFAALQQPFAHVSSEAGENLATVKLALDAELSRARSSLGEIENAASRMKEYSAQLEAASHDALNELHRRLEKILETQTEEMSRRFELLAAGVPQRVAPSLDSLGQQFVERTVAEVESKLAPRLERVPPLLRELASREVQAEEGLRLHRERLRQIAENNQREAAAQLAATLANLRGDFEAARKEALAKWNEELDASGVRAAHAATESIGRTSEWFQQEARARLQVLVEQGLASAGSGLEEQAAESAQKFTSQLDAQSTEHLAQIHQKLDAAAGEVEGRTRTQLEKAAEEAAASFGQVLRSISDQETVGFTNTSRAALRERVHELEHSAGSVLQNFESSAATSLDRLQSQMTEQVEAGVAEGRRALAAESASSLSAYANECAAREKELMLGLEFLTRDVAGKFEERLETTGDSWVISSVRRLNEHGQNAIESLMRSADQSLRDSCSRFFEGLAQTLRERGVFNSNAAGASAFQPIPEKPAQPNDSTSSGSPS